jgi:hypothetical protein
MPTLIADIHGVLDTTKAWIAGSRASGSDAVLRTALPGHGEAEDSQYPLSCANRSLTLQ